MPDRLAALCAHRRQRPVAVSADPGGGSHALRVTPLSVDASDAVRDLDEEA